MPEVFTSVGPEEIDINKATMCAIHGIKLMGLNGPTHVRKV